MGGDNGRFLCLTVCGYKKVVMSEEAYRHHMTQVSAPMTKDLMVKYGIVRWTQVCLLPTTYIYLGMYPSSKGYPAQRSEQVHNQSATRAMMSQLYDPQMARLADFDGFSQVVFRRLDDYKRFKQDPEYKSRLVGDHEKFADTKRSM